MYPRYTIPSDVIAGLVRDTILLRHRIFRDDAMAAVSQLDPPLKIIHQENIPQSGPCVITVNHYYRPDFFAPWFAFAISAMVPMNMHWIVTGELTYPGKWYAPIGMTLSHFALHRIGRVYGFTPMPPMPPRARDVEARAVSVRAVLEYVRHAKNPIVGIAPEGGDQVGGVLTMPASGVGRFALLLAAQGLRFAPVGAYESDGEFCLHFGESYELKIPNNLSTDEKASAASKIIMKNIAPLLPEHLRGEFN
jgi:1-acyl-sn-glycerol-3-phosphate acyltransferase